MEPGIKRTGRGRSPFRQLCGLNLSSYSLLLGRDLGHQLPLSLWSLGSQHSHPVFPLGFLQQKPVMESFSSVVEAVPYNKAISFCVCIHSYSSPSLLLDWFCFSPALWLL